MTLISQLKLLCWKNYILQKRNKLRFSIEILLPILLFVVLIFMRQLGDKKILPDCHFKPKAMPSAGDLAFYQSFYCSLNNTCDDNSTKASLSIYDNSVVSTVMHAIEEAFNLIPQTEINVEQNQYANEQFRKYFKVLKNAVASDKSLAETNIGSFIQSLTVPDDTESRTYTCGPRPLRRVVKREAEWKEEPGGNQDNSTVDEDFSLIDFVESRLLKIADSFLCGPDVPGFADQLLSLAGQTQSSFERRKEELESQSTSSSSRNVEFEEPEYEEDTSEFCNSIMRRLEKSLDTRFVWKIFKPLLRGKIVYTPDAPVINKMMNRINASLAKMRNLYDELKENGEPTGLKELNLIRNNRQFIETLVKSEIGSEVLRFFGVKSDGESDNPKTIDQNVKAFGKLLDNLIDGYNRNRRTNNNFKLMEKYIECIDWSRMVPITDTAEAEKEALNWMKTERLWALVQFVDVEPNATELPTFLTYKIRTGIERTHATFQLRDRVYRPRVRRDPFIDLKHITGGFAYMQNLVESELIREMTGRSDVPGIYLQQTPYPCHIKDMFRESITRILPMFMIVSWVFLFSMLIKKIVWEKEKKLTQTLRVMGVGKAPHWIAWFLDAFIPMVFVSFFLSIILVFGRIMAFTDFFVIWIFLIAFILPTITLAFLVSTCFNKASIAAAVSGLLFLLIYMPYPPMSQFEERIDSRLKIFSCLISNIAFGLGCTWLANMEELGVGGHIGNMGISPVPGNPINMYLILGMLLLDAVLYFLIALYIENVFPGGDAVGRPFYFPFTKSYWLGVDQNKIPVENFTPDLDKQKFEPDPDGLIAGVSVVKLTKKFANKLALNEMTINFYENQITSFLGHNGAGKSTSISIMTGLSGATSGSVSIYGQNLNTDCEIRNRDLGVCSQENVLLDDLTVEEHLYFYACIKGADDKQATNDAYNMMKDVGILNKRDALTKYLSGGTQRKVCVANAFIGGSKVVFLDEPTAGVDPASRRAIWDLLVKYKKGRTVILTTHFMDEADLLGDRIAIIAKGRIVCCGSPVFLKAKLGSGYYLTLDCGKRSNDVGRSMRGQFKEKTQIAQDLDEAVKSVIPDAEYLEQIGTEITFVIPIHVLIEDYQKLFDILDELEKAERITSYGVSDTSLEEIFLKIAEESETVGNDSENSEETFCSCLPWKKTPLYDSVASVDPHANGHAVNGGPVINDVEKKSPWLKFQLQFRALMIKRALHHTRNYTSLIVEIVLPAIFVAISLYLSSLLPTVQKMPPLEIDVSAYAPSYTFYSMDAPQSAILKSYERELLGPVGLGTQCVRSPGKCSNLTVNTGSMVADFVNENLKPCPCNEGRYSCPVPPHSPPWILTSNGDRLYNLTGRNIPNWIVKTELADSYIRYGGLTFGYPRIFNSLNLPNLFDLFNLKSFIKLLSDFGINTDGNNASNDTNNEPPQINPKQVAQILMTACSKSIGDKLLENADVNDNIIIWYNNRGWISGIAYMNAVSNLVLRASLPSNVNSSKYGIRLINHPLPITARQFDDEIEKQSNISLLRALTVVWALAFIPATYAVYLIGERSSGFKHLQMISGVGRIVYWTSTFLWDFLCFGLTILVIIFIFLCYGETGYVGPASIGPFILVLFSYAAVSITIVYPISFLFRVPSSGFVAVSTMNIFIGMVTLLTTFVISLITAEDNPYYLNSIFMVFPQFCLGKALLNMAVTAIRVRTLATFGVIDHPDYFEWDTTTKYVTFMLITSVISFFVTMIIEWWPVLIKHKERLPEPYEDNDDDVANERNRVVSGSANDDILLLKNISKWYPGEKRPAVDRLCVGVKTGECFGLLGLNGAGKTTVFKMLTGSLKPSGGDATILNESIQLNGELPLGYCPQTNALDPYLTTTEHLEFFSQLHGRDLDNTVARNIERLGLETQRDKLSSALSGGNKRKLNTALALVGEPRLVLLDEPTSGMDPRARRFLWQCVQNCVLDGRCVILTSHSMEECQSLCTRLSILVNGRFHCLGTCQHLKKKFDEGYSVVVRCAAIESLTKVQSILTEKLPKITKFEINYLQIKFRLSPGASLGLVFSVLDQAKREQLIRDYSISQTTLEQIFIKFAESQVIQESGDSTLSNLFSFCSCFENTSNTNVESLPQQVVVIETMDDPSN